VIIAKFPTQKLTDEEIEASADLDELKDALLVRNNSHYRNATFELVVPKRFNLDAETFAGPITSTDIDGSVKLTTHGGEIEIANVSGTAQLKSHGGHIDLGNVGEDANVETHGGHIVVMDIDGEFIANTHGGHISAGRIAGSSEALTHGGKIEFFEATGPVKAESRGGSIRVLKARNAVDATAHAGRVEVNFIDQPKGESKLTSHAGSVAVGYSKGIGFSIDARTMNGRISGPFLAKKIKNSLTHQLNGGTAKLQINSDNGSVKFKVIDENELERELNEDRKRSAGRKAFQKAYDLHMEGRIDEAIPAHQAAAEYEDEKLLATYNLGCAYALKGKVNKAFKALNKAIDFGMDDIDQFEGDRDLDSLRKDERYKELITRMKAKMIEKEQSRAEKRELLNLVSKGHSLFRGKDFEEAELHFKTALQIEPENEDAMFMLGSSIHALGRLDEAYELHKLVADSKNSLFAGKGNYNLACVHALRDDTDGAIKFLRKAIKAGYHNIKHMKHDEDLKSIRNDDRFDDLIDMLEEIIEEGADDIADDTDSEGTDEDCGFEAETSGF
jgi:tetratricopeptide (TPR) repeat protein